MKNLRHPEGPLRPGEFWIRYGNGPWMSDFSICGAIWFGKITEDGYEPLDLSGFFIAA